MVMFFGMKNRSLFFVTKWLQNLVRNKALRWCQGVKREDMRKHLVANGMVKEESGDEILTEDKIKNQLKKVGTAEREQRVFRWNGAIVFR